MADEAKTLRDQLFALGDSPTVHSEEIGGKTWYFRELSTAAADEFTPIAMALHKGEPVEGSWRAKIIRMTLSDSSGMLLFTPANEKQIAQLPSSKLNDLAMAAMEHSGIMGGDEEAEKN